jgi:predicted patatin/cPLA2 family phospholipase
MQKIKKALIVEGGGSRGVFSFGVIDSFIKASYNPFDIHLGVSNGASRSTLVFDKCSFRLQPG